MADPQQQQIVQQASSSMEKADAACLKCKLPMDGQFVRALGGCFHLHCFQCQDCGKVVATRFFPLEENGQKFPLCERDYFDRLKLLCANCGEALRGSYVTALGRKYHLEHFTCSMCPTVFGPNETYYEHSDNVFCYYHYSLHHASMCGGCRLPILKQFVDIRSNKQEHWHPECYMIFKSWNIRMGSKAGDVSIADMSAAELKLAQQVMDEKTSRIWNVLSAFEESAAACISDMLLHVSNQSYVDAVGEAGNFIMHVEALFCGIDNLESEMARHKDSIDLNYGREPKMLSKKIVNFFSLLSHTQDTGVKQYGTITQELLALVTSLAQYLKILIRIALAGALKLERRHNNETAVGDFLNKLVELGEKQVSDEAETNVRFDQRYKITDTDVKSDLCASCKISIETSCIRLDNIRWHKKCFRCSATDEDLSEIFSTALFDTETGKIYGPRHGTPTCKPGFENVTQLEQYTFLLRVALRRLYGLLKVKDDSLSVSYALLKEPSSTSLNRVGSSDSQSQAKGSEEVLESGAIAEKASHESSAEDLSPSKAPRESAPSRRVIPTRVGVDSVHNLVEEVGKPSRSTGLSTSRPIAIPSNIASNKSLSNSLPEVNGSHPNEDSWPMSPGDSGTKVMTTLDGKRGTAGATTTYLSEIGGLEMFMVHHLVVLRLGTLVQDSFKLNELMDMLKNRKATFWTKMLASLRPGKKQTKPKESGTFGMPLENLVEKFGTETTQGNGFGRLRVPVFIESTIASLRKSNLKTEGIFRKNGNIKHLNEMQVRFDDDPSKITFEGENSIQIAALLKKFLRDLPEPLLTFKLHRLFIVSQKYPNAETKKKILHYCVCLLPKPNRDVLLVLLSFLREVGQFAGGENGNKMDVQNLATVIAPNILYGRPKDKPDFADKEESFLAIDCVKMLLDCQDDFWTVPTDIVEVMQKVELPPADNEVAVKDVLKKYETVLKQDGTSEGL